MKTIPILQFFTGSDYDLLFRRIPAEKLQEHLASDRAFFEELITRCQKAGIPIRARRGRDQRPAVSARPDHPARGRFGAEYFSGSIDLLLELVAAFCLGEVEISPVT